MNDPEDRNKENGSDMSVRESNELEFAVFCIENVADALGVSVTTNLKG